MITIIALELDRLIMCCFIVCFTFASDTRYF
jgi:hypothetical protein